MILLSIMFVLVGLVLLTYGADRFVIGASGVGRNLGMSPMLIGLTIVAFATSAPEILVAAVAALDGATGLAVGNAVGSNIANIGLVLGVTALLSPLLVHSSSIRREFPVMFLVLLLAYGLIWDGELGRLDGIILLSGLLLLIISSIYLAKNSSTKDPVREDFNQELAQELPIKTAIFWLLIGAVLLLLGSHALVKGAVDIAQALGVSDLVIGLTIVAVGTSLPELAASVMSALKGEQDMALGNIIGSNMFNMLAVLAVPGLIRPAAVGSEVLHRDFPFMLLLSVLMFFMSFGFRKAGKITRLNGVILLLGFLIYQLILFRGSV